MIGDLTSSPEPIEIKLFSPDPTLLSRWAPKMADRIKKIKGVADVKDGIENTISGSAIVMNVDPVVAARVGFHAAGNRTGRERDSARRAGDHAGGGERPRLHDSRALSGRRARDRWSRSATRMITSSSTGKTATLGLAGGSSRTKRGRPKFMRENLQRRVAVTGRFEGVSLGKGMETGAAGGRRYASAAGDSRGLRRDCTRSSRNRSTILLVVLVLAVVLVFTVLLFEFRTFAAPTAILASALLSTSGVFFGAADHGDDVQHLVVHGADHGDRHRGEERHPAARRRSAVSRAKGIPRATR